MIGFFERLTRPLLHALDPEDAHALAISMLKFAPLPAAAASTFWPVRSRKLRKKSSRYGLSSSRAMA